MKQYLFFSLLFLIGQISFSQIEALTAEERAYIFHIVKKSPILDNSIGRYFEYQGEPIYLSNGELNYDSLETMIINQPEILKIHTSEIRKSSIGILSEAANKTAIWELNKMLLAYRTDDKKNNEIYQNRLQPFLDSLIQYFPESALKSKDGQWILKGKVKNLLNPSMSLNDRVKMIETFKFIDKNDKLIVLKAINKAINGYVQNRSYLIFNYLGGQTEHYQNVLVAAGDGSLTAGILEEREKDERGRWNKGLPKAIGLFPYQLYMKEETNERNKKVTSTISPAAITRSQFQTYGNQQITTIHFDVWGYNSEKQTTVVIEKNGKTYHLFGSGENRFLSPDSAFAKGVTYQFIIDGYQKKIDQIEEKINGKKGFDYWIAFYESRKVKLLYEIVELERQLANVDGFTVTTKGRDKKGKAGVLGNTQSNQKKRSSKQTIYFDKNEQLSATKKKIKDLQKEKEEAIDVQNVLKQKKSIAIDAFGRHWVPFTEKDGVYTFQDSTTFDILTQDLVFPAKDSIEEFEIRLIAIPSAVDSPLSDEVMLHINSTASYPKYDSRIQLAFNDVFASNSWELTNPLITAEDSISVRVFLEQLLDKKKNFTLKLRGNGLGVRKQYRTVFSYDQEEISSYPSEEAKNDVEFKRLRASYVDVQINRDITLEINSFTDNVRTNFDIPNKTIAKLIEKQQASYNQILSGYRTASILFKIQEELNLFAGTSFSREEAKIIIDRLNTAINKSKILVNRTSLKASLFK